MIPKRSEKHEIVDDVKSFFNADTDEDTENAYEAAKAERDFIRLYNMGNTHLKNKELDSAIESYEEALKIKEDEETRMQLELVKKQKKKEALKEKKHKKKKEDKE
mgnify:CR=1 FL=1